MKELYQPDKIGQWGKIEGGDKGYFSFPAVSNSRLKKWLKSPAHFKRNEPSKPSKAMQIGTAFHTLVLETQNFYLTYEKFEKPEPEKSMALAINKEALQFIIDSGKTPLSVDDWDSVHGMDESLFKSQVARKVFKKSEGINEQGYWYVHQSGIICKIKPDRLAFVKNGSAIILADLKKCQEASIPAFEKACKNYDYPLQDAFYTKGLETIFPEKDILPFHFFMVEENAPHYSQHYTISLYQREIIKSWIDTTLFEIADYIKEDKPFYAYSNPESANGGLIEIELSDYYLSKFLNQY